MLLLVAFILFISTVNGKELKVEQKPVCIDAVQGVDVHLYCLFPPLEEKKQYTHWKHNRGDKEKKILKENNKTKLELVAGNSTISLTNVQPEDSGVYYCTVGVTDGEARGNGTTLTVYKYFSDIQSQNKDNTSDFQCVVIGADERESKGDKRKERGRCRKLETKWPRKGKIKVRFLKNQRNLATSNP
nr:PREDICTED: platelet-derived growth factor receptor alpha-like [Latimeria chalumnae]|eukprot:XP_014354099.1 PREDICTED: platelet-derived growth factor receptor alpha-like [Latimeria chalumnae]